MNSSKRLIVLLHWSPWSLRWADGSELKSSAILLTPEWGENVSVCVSAPHFKCVTFAHTPCLVKNSIKTPKLILFSFAFCLCTTVFLLLFTSNPKFSLKCKGFLPLSVTLLLNLPISPHCTWELSWLVRLFASLSFSASYPFSLLGAPGGCSYSSVGVWGKYKYLCCTGPITLPDCFCELYVLHISINTVDHLFLIADIQITTLRERCLTSKLSFQDHD